MVSRLIVGTRKGLFLFEQGTGGWRIARTAHLGIPVTYAFQDARTGLLWASLEHGHWGVKLHVSADMGETWREIPAPKYPDGETYGEGKPASLSLIWTIAPGPVDEPGTLYLGTGPGGLFKSTDGGETFALNEGLWRHPTRPKLWFGGGRDYPAIHSVVVDPRDKNRMLVAVSCAGVFETVDDGASWTPRNQGQRCDFLPDPASPAGHDPHVLAATAADADVIWQQNHCGVYRSTDSGRTWNEISDPKVSVDFGFAIAAHPDDGDTAWVVPAVADRQRMAPEAGLAVCRTTDGGKSWTPFRAGLPSPSFDLVFRHALDATGKQVAFGSTSGNLFASDDSGETWQTLSYALPPVHSVRFVP
ncbi:MAG: hypothetical protein KC620_19240 [Myxococcales bacterium]|nr:hypothetical protein [Myxococcales bacterium]